MSPENLLRLKTVLEQHLPESLQIMNVIILSIADDGINRTVFVNDNFNTENVAVMVMDRLETPRLNITMFSSTGGEEDLKKILLENLDWTQEMEFGFLNERKKLPKFQLIIIICTYTASLHRITSKRSVNCSESIQPQVT